MHRRPKTNKRLRQDNLSHYFRNKYHEISAVEYKLPKWYTYAQKRMENNFTPENFKGVVEKYPSPCKNFTFVVEKYQKSIMGLDYIYYRGTIYSHIKEVAKVSSSANKFWHCWVQKEDKLYLLCNEDSQGYTFVDVKNGVNYPYIDPKAKDGWGFSWKEVAPSPDGKFLAVQGDYMESVKEIALYDLSEIKTPLRKIKRLDVNIKSGCLVLKGWRERKVVIEYVNQGKSIIIEVEV